MIWTYLQENKMRMMVLIAPAAWGFYRLTAKPISASKDRDLVPAHVRFNRRESELGNRRQSGETSAASEDGPPRRRLVTQQALKSGHAGVAQW
ncbi:MAG: hypothetical protein Q7J29_11020 [Stagnimonas sp.]|nr:hypothetical protein [Stagnimonas sp.]